MSVGGRVISTWQYLNKRDPAFQLLRHQEVDGAIIYRDPADLIDFGMGSCGADISVFSCSDSSIASKVWPLGCHTSQLLTLLVEHSKQGVVIHIDDLSFDDLVIFDQSDNSLCLITVSSDREAIGAMLSGGYLVVAVQHLGESEVELIFGSKDSLRLRQSRYPLTL